MAIGASVAAEASAPVEASPPGKARATFSAHELIEASHERLRQAQAERLLVAGIPEGDGADENAGGSTALGSPSQLSYAAAPAAPSLPRPPRAYRAASSQVRAEFGSAPPSIAPPDPTESAPPETAAVGGPLLPPLPEPEPLSLPLPSPAPDAGERQEVALAEAPEEARDAGERQEVALAAAPEEAPALATAMRIAGSRVNVRSGPSTADERLFRLDLGDRVDATETRAGWTKIEDAAGRTGWVLSEYLAGVDEAEVADTVAAAPAADAPVEPAAAPEPEPEAAAAPEPSDVRTVAGSGVTVRKAPSNSGARLFALVGGEQVTVTGSEKGWLRIVDDSGRTGWAYSSFLSKR